VDEKSPKRDIGEMAQPGNLNPASFTSYPCTGRTGFAFYPGFLTSTQRWPFSTGQLVNTAQENKPYLLTTAIPSCLYHFMY
jgi:hypothetical protein